MRVYALVDGSDPEAIEMYLDAEDAQRALDDCLLDEPQWFGRLRVEAIELETQLSPN
jgi:hypothetical protein